MSQKFIIISHAVSEKSQLHNEDDDGTDSDGAGPHATCKLSGVFNELYQLQCNQK